MSNQHHKVAYPFASLAYFFSPSELIDWELGLYYRKNRKLHLQDVFQALERTTVLDEPYNLLALWSYFFREEKQTPPDKFPVSLLCEQKNVEQYLQNDGLKLTLSLLVLKVEQMPENSQESVALGDEVALKVLLNTLYLLIYYLEQKNNLNITKERSSSQLSELIGKQKLNKFYRDTDIDSFLMKLITLSLEAHYIPIKKVCMLYMKVLANIFSFQRESLTYFNIGRLNSDNYRLAELQQEVNKKNAIQIDPIQIFDQKLLETLPQQNTVSENYLERLKQTRPPSSSSQEAKTVTQQPIEEFYRKHNMGDCPLAQSVVVGILRSLLTICNNQNHKKFATIQGTGVDSFREWQLSYRFALDQLELIGAACSPLSKQALSLYQKFDKNPEMTLQSNTGRTIGEGQNVQEEEQVHPLFEQFYRHKIHTAAVLVDFLIFLTVALKKNVLIQSLYLLQLLSDANGILVFLKFLTDKFLFVDLMDDSRFQYLTRQDAITDSTLRGHFKTRVMLTVYSILQMLRACCNNFPQKVKGYLFEYNSHLIIKKIPSIFCSPKAKDQSKNDQSLPSREDLEQLIIGQNFENGSLQEIQVVSKLTESCYELLKLQIPFFSKKNKETSNMRMLIDLYCRFPKKTSPINRTLLQKAQLKAHLAQNQKDQEGKKYINSVEEMKNMQNEYNNLYYWSNDFLQSPKDSKTRNAKQQSQEAQKVSPRVDLQEWLEKNVWKFYD